MSSLLQVILFISKGTDAPTRAAWTAAMSEIQMHVWDGGTVKRELSCYLR